MFSRSGRASGRHVRADRARGDRSRPERALADEPETGAEPETADQRETRAEDAAAAAPEPADAAEPAPEPAGPYDAAEAPPQQRRLDLGSLRIPSLPGVEVRVQANQEGNVAQVFLVHGESVLQLGVFAAPRSEPIWDEVRADIRTSLFDDGVAAEEVDGPYGTELRARLRTQEGLKDLRFVGVNGPRWMLRAVYQGPAAVDPGKAGPLAECLRGLVVDRGDEARPAKEPLPLKLSEELAAQVPRGQGAGAQVPGARQGGSAPAATQPVAAPGARVPPAGAGSSGAGSSGTGSSGAGASGAGSSRAGAAPRRKPSPRPRRRGPEEAGG